MYLNSWNKLKNKLRHKFNVFKFLEKPRSMIENRKLLHHDIVRHDILEQFETDKQVRFKRV
ncbi:unknown [Spodoptera litura nucleopolyhedrovirus]|uniref:Uncharacterized protein n=1 Tax=Spodoptera litura multicapsid nucleopolyhedrovirus TaxID=46242 RepID=Q91B97_NPVST|nr:hypothetical protein [Spodoptera litura nucleopolyhedrovirus]AAL01829.1 unknown [Spodoptera litura nucleopolyhedrovirus]